MGASNPKPLASYRRRNHKKRKEALQYTKGDVVKTTEISDISAEFDLLTMFDEWPGERA